MAQVTRPENIRHCGGAHRHAGVAGLCFLDGVDGEEAEGIDAELVELRRRGQGNLLAVN